MAKVKSSDEQPMMPPGLTPDSREKQLIALAVDEAERRIRDGTASSQLLTHYLRLGSSEQRLRNEKLEEENKLLRAKTKALEDAADMKELYSKAIKAMALYSGNASSMDEEDDDYEEDYDY